jgi:hypothetical protein
MGVTLVCLRGRPLLRRIAMTGSGSGAVGAASAASTDGDRAGITWKVCATGAAAGVGAFGKSGGASRAGKPSSQHAARTPKAGGLASSAARVGAPERTCTTSTVLLPRVPRWRILRTSRRSPAGDLLSRKRAKTRSISDIMPQDLLGRLVAIQRSPCLRLPCAALLTSPASGSRCISNWRGQSLGLALPELAFLPSYGARPAGGRGGSFDIAVRCPFRT